MLRPIAALVAARLRRRGTAALLSVAAIGTSTALVALVAGIGLIATDATLERALATTGTDRPVVRVTDFSPSARDAAAVQAAAGQGLAGLDPHVDPLVRGVLVHELRDLDSPVFELLVAVDDPEAWTTLLEGRLPAPCIDGIACEAVLLAQTPPPFAFEVAHPAPDLRLTIVGRGQLDPAVPFGDLDQRGPFGDQPGGGQYQTGRASPAVLLVNGVDALAASPALERTGRTYVWTAPLDVGSVRPWTVSALRDAVAAATRDLARADGGFTLASPVPLVDTELGRAEAARGRLLLIGSFGVAILLAFVVFLALVVREDVAAEVARLVNVGARRRERIAFLALEAAVPAVVGGVLGWIGGAIAVGSIAAWDGRDAVAIVGGTVAAPGTLGAMAAVLAVAVAATALATAPGGPGRGGLRSAAAVGAAVVVLLGWELLAGGSLGGEALARSVASPVVVLLPPVLAFLLALAFVAILPPLLRALARRSSRAPLAVRLSLLSITREPARPAATLTLLAFSLGAIVFAAGWSASLQRGIVDGSTYRSGLDLRVSELGTGLSIGGSVVPVARYDALGPGITAVPVYRDGAPNQPGGRVDVLGIPPDALPTLPGWRSDFSASPASELARALTEPAPAGGWTRSGHRLPDGVRELTLRFAYDGRPLRLDAIVATADGDTATIPMGDLGRSMTSVRAPLPEGAAGGLLTALILRNPGLVAGSGHQDELRGATIRFLGLDGLVDDAPIDLEVFTTSAIILRAPQVTDGLRLPAVVSPDLAASAAADGSLDLAVGNDATIPLRIVGIATHAPTVIDRSPRFVIVPLEPFLVALASAVPGAGRPTEMWIGLPDAGTAGRGRGEPGRAPVPVRPGDRSIGPHRDPSRRSAEPGHRLDAPGRCPGRTRAVDRRAAPRGHERPARRARRAGRPRGPGRAARRPASARARPDRLARGRWLACRTRRRTGPHDRRDGGPVPDGRGHRSDPAAARRAAARADQRDGPRGRAGRPRDRRVADRPDVRPGDPRRAPVAADPPRGDGADPRPARTTRWLRRSAPAA